VNPVTTGIGNLEIHTDAEWSREMSGSTHGGLQTRELSDDDLDVISGGIPFDERDPTFALGIVDSGRRMTETQLRPTDDPGLWY
jgi:hypothetical protein